MNQHGELFITMAAHGFEVDGLVWHPTPHQGKIIGTVVDSIPDTNIAIAKLNKGLRYTNHTFGTTENSGNEIAGISPNYPPHTFVGDIISMDNPYSGFCETRYCARGKDSRFGQAVHCSYLVDSARRIEIDGRKLWLGPFEMKRTKPVGFFRYNMFLPSQQLS